VAKKKYRHGQNSKSLNQKKINKSPSFFQQFKVELITAIVLIAITGVITWKLVQGANNPAGKSNIASSTRKTGLPKMIDLGTTSCTPCKMMIPVMEELTEEYANKLIVEFINTAENPDKSAEYNISVIPTQIFYDKKGKELTRHTGFISKEDVVKTFQDFGINLN
jgi:thioredoxin 1